MLLYLLFFTFVVVVFGVVVFVFCSCSFNGSCCRSISIHSPLTFSSKIERKQFFFLLWTFFVGGWKNRGMCLNYFALNLSAWVFGIRGKKISSAYIRNKKTAFFRQEKVNFQIYQKHFFRENKKALKNWILLVQQSKEIFAIFHNNS